MKTDSLMSSLREMIRAECDLVRAEACCDRVAETVAREQYSRHETVVREQLEKLGDEAGKFQRGLFARQRTRGYK